MTMFRLVALALVATTLSACNDSGESRQVLRVASGHIVMPVSPDRPAAGYFTVEGGSAPVELVAVTSDLAQRVEMHQTVKEDGLTTMKALVRSPVPVQGKLEFKPGGNHLMIWNINGAAVRAGRLPMVFIFSNNDRILFDLSIRKPEAAQKAGEDHKGH